MAQRSTEPSTAAQLGRTVTRGRTGKELRREAILWLGTLLLGTAALSLALTVRFGLLGPNPTPLLGMMARLLVIVSAGGVAILGVSRPQASARLVGAAGALLALALLLLPNLPLLGLGWSAVTPLIAMALLYRQLRRELSERTIDQLSGWLLVLPALLLMLLWVYFPALYAFWISLFEDFNYLSAAKFVALKNYAIALRDPLFLQALLNTGWYVIGTVPISIFLGVLIAILLNQRIRGLAIYRVAYFLPYITALTAAAAVWRWIYNPNAGLLNWLLGLEGFRWLANPDGIIELALSPLGVELPRALAGPSVALVAIMIMSIWHFLGYNVVIFLAGLQSIPREYYEAARIDGAGSLQQIRFITWPLLAPTTFFVLIISLIGSLNVFTQIFILTPTGGVLNDTLSVVMYLYFKGFRDFDFGYASALAFILFVLTLVLTLLQRRLFNRRFGFEGGNA